MVIKAKVNTNNTIVVTKQNVPGMSTLKNLTDVDATTLEDGSVLMYEVSANKFKVTTNISLTGTNYVSGGNF
ncbi:MAG: hypothetical protein QF535_02440 [Anaerolineales bacterium]|jgi:hypothetical protein|nr:hypothetical protein [Anaerolineales bacterium]|tara:strand:+ start:535 stop:750 length:216 start_codon:yes stop_codon:yes gene_type:complete